VVHIVTLTRSSAIRSERGASLTVLAFGRTGSDPRVMVHAEIKAPNQEHGDVYRS
jgi:hypothetical protein